MQTDKQTSEILRRIFKRELTLAREFFRRRREMEIRHARERADLSAWEIEVQHYLREGNCDV